MKQKQIKKNLEVPKKKEIVMKMPWKEVDLSSDSVESLSDFKN